MTPVNLPYLHIYLDRHGKTRAYYRRGKFSKPVKGTPGTDEFLDNYNAVHGAYKCGPALRPAKGTFRYLCEEYFKSTKFSDLSDRSKAEYRRLLKDMQSRIGEQALDALEEPHFITWQSGRVDVPREANNTLALLKQVFAYGVRLKLLPVSPVKDLEPLKIKSKGWRAWSEAALTRWGNESRGTPRLAFYLGLYTGQRRGDILKMRWSDVQNELIYINQRKTDAELWVPIHPRLASELSRVEKRGMTIIQKENGQPLTDHGFGSLWSKEQARLGIKLPFHGLRKSAVSALFEAGCTPQEVQAITGHTTLAMVQGYGKDANQKRLAKSAMRKLLNEGGTSGG